MSDEAKASTTEEFGLSADLAKGLEAEGLSADDLGLESTSADPSAPAAGDAQAPDAAAPDQADALAAEQPNPEASDSSPIDAAPDSAPTDPAAEETTPATFTAADVEKMISDKLADQGRTWKERLDGAVSEERQRIEAERTAEADTARMNELYEQATDLNDPVHRAVRADIDKARQPDPTAAANEAAATVYRTDLVDPIRGLPVFEGQDRTAVDQTIREAVAANPQMPGAALIPWVYQQGLTAGRSAGQASAEATRTEAATKAMRQEQPPADQGDPGEAVASFDDLASRLADPDDDFADVEALLATPGGRTLYRDMFGTNPGTEDVLSA